MYRPTPGALAREEMSTALAYADAAVVVLLHLQAQATAGRLLPPALSEPLELRAEVHQATGFVSIQASVGLTEALLLLRAHAFASGRPLLHVARDVLAGRLRVGPDEE
jgi:AmiR/NasT family two-component response regulator